MVAGERRRRRFKRGGRESDPLAYETPAPPDGEPDESLLAAAHALTVDAARQPPAAGEAIHRPSPADLAERSGSFAMTAGVHDPEPAAEPPAHDLPHHHDHRYEEAGTERGLRGLIGG